MRHYTKDQIEISEAWEYLTECGIATEEELQLITSINGYNIESIESVIYCRTGYRSIEQLKECEG